jgi:DNA repair exonuclease SbcCD nuclease subunit
MTLPRAVIRILLVADTHLGFDLPFHPRVQRRRRGGDFFANLDRALRPALDGEVDLVVHGGDLLYRSRVPPALVDMALAPLVRVAEAGVPVFLVPGNHERSRIPLHLWASHPNLRVLDEPRTFVLPVADTTLALSGFPYAREVRDGFVPLVEQTGYRRAEAGVRLLCMHQIVEGAQVGPGDYTFRSNPDVVRGRDIPVGFAAVLSGHIHRAQVLRCDLAGRALAAPVIYPGSVERTAFAERYEQKGYAMVRLGPCEQAGRPVQQPPVLVQFVPLPARPMAVLSLEAVSLEPAALTEQVRRELRALDPDAVVRIELRGRNQAGARGLLSAAGLRSLAPSTMNVELAPERPARLPSSKAM